METFYYILGACIFLTIICGAAHILLPCKAKASLCVPLFAACLIGTGLIMYGGMQFSDNRYRSVFFLLSGCASIPYIFLVFAVKPWAKIFFALTAILFINLSSALFYIITPYLPGIPIPYDGLFTGLFWLAMIPLLLKLRQPLRAALESVGDKTFVSLSLYPLLADITLSYFRYAFWEIPSIFSLLIVIFAAAGAVLLLVAINEAGKKSAAENEKRLFAQIDESARENYAVLNAAIENAKIAAHDSRHHVRTVQHFMEESNYNAAKDYLAKLDRHYVSLAIPRICMNSAADSVLKYYSSICARDSVAFDCRANIPQETVISDIDLSSVLSNCLENALTAVRRLEGAEMKKIALTAETAGNFLIIKVENPYLPGASSAPGSGLGLTSIGLIARKYNGRRLIRSLSGRFEIEIVLQND